MTVSVMRQWWRSAELQLCAARSLSERNLRPGGTCDNSPTFQRWGTSGKDNLVPKGRLRALRQMPGQIHCRWRNTAFHSKLVSELSAVPSGLMIPLSLVPNVETLGYCQESLRDENEILRESVVWHGLPAFRDSNSVSSDKSVRQSIVEKGDSSGISVGPRYPKTEGARLYSACERATEWLIYFMVVFSPWAFGTTQAWSIEVMNCAGYLLGGLLAAKWLLRWSKSLSENYR